MCLHNTSHSPREQRGTLIDEYTLDIELIYSFWRGGRPFGECAVKTLGTWQRPVHRNSPALHFNTVVICRHHYLMKHTAVQEEQEAGFGNEGSAGNLATMSSGISLTQSRGPSFLCPPPAQPPVTIQNDHFNYTNNQAEKLQYKSCPLTQLRQVYFYKPRS